MNYLHCCFYNRKVDEILTTMITYEKPEQKKKKKEKKIYTPTNIQRKDVLHAIIANYSEQRELFPTKRKRAAVYPDIFDFFFFFLLLSVA